MERKLTIIAVIGLIVILGLVWSKQYGLNPNLNFSSAEAVAVGYTKAFIAANNTGFFNRQDKIAYNLLTAEAKGEVNAQTGSLLVRLIEFNKGSLPPSSFNVRGLTEQGDKASVNFTWIYSEPGGVVGKTIFLVKRGDKWEIYSVVNSQS